jgi:hypothetical protein
MRAALNERQQQQATDELPLSGSQQAPGFQVRPIVVLPIRDDQTAFIINLLQQAHKGITRIGHGIVRSKPLSILMFPRLRCLNPAKYAAFGKPIG